VKTTLGGDTTAIHDLADLISHLAQTEVAFGSGSGHAAVVRAIEVRVAVERDPVEHRARLEKELIEAKETLRRSRDLLARPGFEEKAPANVVANEKAKLAEREERVRLLEEELRRAA
jgi:valyl-tRNA synthetase